MNDQAAAKAEIFEVVQNWVLWRDTDDWERFATVWHAAGHMSATCFHGPAADFIAASRAGSVGGAQVQRLLGGTTVEVAGDHAIAQTRVSILQRATVDGVEIDVTNVGRFHDFFLRDERGWCIRPCRGVHEKNWVTPVDVTRSPRFDDELLGAYPPGYRYTAYVQTKSGLTVRQGLPGHAGPELDQLYQEGKTWLAGAEDPGPAV
ncbi:nuclear transport factor 2 family protein [Amycolatopsis sp. FDAARGOS 1241]|uniref:nuclear transport factor 2 family protein n=1 Tax=Amycolatopsis sp. FDAARGOS 1241 TaxID=2778070 RepID=UPI00194E84FB|nr:nuclear transport factor 2 family protein [Amycolatopsis sp. FDAARGOS 1241]QRP48561.1 nuclear transport factor 2 family protein [Amycolatopsis sp. FDAARGOS 1241]